VSPVKYELGFYIPEDTILYIWFSLHFIYFPPGILYSISMKVKMDLLEIGLNVLDWIGLGPDRYSWRAPVNTVMNLRVP
jgi:hypothetical protein